VLVHSVMFACNPIQVLKYFTQCKSGLKSVLEELKKLQAKESCSSEQDQGSLERDTKDELKRGYSCSSKSLNSCMLT
jgi:hypothetical protein